MSDLAVKLLSKPTGDFSFHYHTEIFKEKITMAMWHLASLIIFILCLVSNVSAFDGGDAVALILGLIIGIMGICACIGCYARKQRGESF